MMRVTRGGKPPLSRLLGVSMDNVNQNHDRDHDPACQTKLAILEQSVASLERRGDKHDETIEKHDERIDLLERTSAARDKEIANLIEQLKATTSTMQWFIGIFFVSYMGFFVWYIQGVKR